MSLSNGLNKIVSLLRSRGYIVNTRLQEHLRTNELVVVPVDVDKRDEATNSYYLNVYIAVGFIAKDSEEFLTKCEDIIRTVDVPNIVLSDIDLEYSGTVIYGRIIFESIEVIDLEQVS